MLYQQQCSCGGSILVAKVERIQDERLITIRDIQCRQCGARATSEFPEEKEAA